MRSSFGRTVIVALVACSVLVLASPGSAQTFKRGDADGNGCVEDLDAIFIQNFIFVPGSPPPACFDAADADDDGVVTGTSDPLFILNYLLVAGSPPPPPPGPTVCGTDPTPASSLGCQTEPDCP